MKPVRSRGVSVIAAGLVCAALAWGSARAQVFYRSDGVPIAPDQQLIIESNNPLRFRSTPAPKVSSLETRRPTDAEEGVVLRAKELFERSAAKAMVLIDGRTVIWQAAKPPATDASLYLGFSMTKSLTALAVGKAICAKKMDLDEPAERYVQELRETDIGRVSIRDLLRMASGARASERFGFTYTAEEFRKIVIAGEMSYLEWLQQSRVNSADSFFGRKTAPGTKFAYKSADPILLGIALSRAVEKPFAEWLQDEVLHPAGIAGPAVITQDRLRFAGTDGLLRMQLMDWVRVAAWVGEQRRANDCFSQFLQEASRKQIGNSDGQVGQLFSGYGYLFWTDNRYAPESYWAAGHGGQRIGWSTTNRRMIVVFSSAEDWMPELSRLFNEWTTVGTR